MKNYSMEERLQQLEDTYVANSLATSGASGLTRLGRVIGELFIKEHANSHPQAIVDDYKKFNERVWNKSQHAGDGFGRAVGKFVADAFLKIAEHNV